VVGWSSTLTRVADAYTTYRFPRWIGHRVMESLGRQCPSLDSPLVHRSVPSCGIEHRRRDTTQLPYAFSFHPALAVYSVLIGRQLSAYLINLCSWIRHSFQISCLHIWKRKISRQLLNTHTRLMQSNKIIMIKSV